MAGYFDPQYGWVGTGGKEETMPLPAGLRRAADAVFNPGDPHAEEMAQAGQDPRFPFDPSLRAIPSAPPPVVAAVAPATAMPTPSPVIHEAGYRPDSFPAGDIRTGFSEDRSRGERGLDWASDINRRHGDSEVVRAPDHVGAHTQGELESMANARRLMDEAYGPTHEAFDPVAAEVEALNDQAKLKVAEHRAQDPVAFLREQQEIPEQAKMNAQIAAGGRIASILGSFTKSKDEVARRRAELQAALATGSYTPQAKAAAIAKVDAEEKAIEDNLQIIKDAMQISTGHRPNPETFR